MAAPQKLDTHIPHVLEDPQAEAIAAVYADAFLDAAGNDAPSALEELASFLDDVLAKNPDFNKVLVSEMIGPEEKEALVERVVAKFGGPLFTNFLKVLARHGRLDLLPLISKESRLRHEKRSGKQRVKVTSAKPLSEAALTKIREQLAKTLPFDPILESKVDPALVGGLVIRVGDTVYDGSLRTRLKQLRVRMRERSLNEIQSGRDRFSHP